MEHVLTLHLSVPESEQVLVRPQSQEHLLQLVSQCFGEGESASEFSVGEMLFSCPGTQCNFFVGEVGVGASENSLFL